MQSKHISIMVPEVLEMLAAARGGRFLDCTLGGAGHTQAILNAHPQNYVLSTDRDDRALKRAENLRQKYGERFEAKKASFFELAAACAGLSFDGILADLGLSTDQLHESRGFSFNDQGPLDMRMDEQQQNSASDVVNLLSEKQLYVTLRQGGVGPEALLVAKAIVDQRPIASTKQLVGIVNAAVESFIRKKPHKKIHPATVVLQAIRMAVNQEIEQIEALTNFVPHVVKNGARLVVLTFHSLEDKAVAQRMRSWESGGEFSASFPGSRPGVHLGRMLTRKAIEPSASEVERNPSSRSARLRAFEFVL